MGKLSVLSAFSPEKLNKLRAFLQAIPKPLVDRLIAVADKGDPALAEILRFCAGDPDAEAMDWFFKPLEALGKDPEDSPPSLAIVPAQVRKNLWAWLDQEIAPEITERARTLVGEAEGHHERELDGDRRLAAQKILEAFKAVEDHPKEQKILMRRLETHDLSAYRHAATLLRTSEAVRVALREVPKRIGELNEKLLIYIRDAYELAYGKDPDAGVWFLYMIMARLRKPWMILRVFQRLDRRGDDFLVSRTDTSGIGDALLKDAEYFVDQIRSPNTMEEADASIYAVQMFAAVTVGMTREFGIRKDGPWGQKLFALRADAARHMESIHQRTRLVFDEVLPDRKRTRGKPWRMQALQGHLDYIRMEALLHFLYKTKDDASRAAVEGAHKTLLEHIYDRLDDFSNALIDAIRLEKVDDWDEGEAQLTALAQLMRVGGKTEEATVVVRRGVAAHAA